MDHNHFPGTHNIEIEIEDHHNQAVNSRTMQDPQRLRKNISLILILLLVFMLVFVLLIQDVAIAAVLGSADKQCENIERSWLIIWAVINSISSLIAFPVKKFVFDGKGDKKGCPTLWKVLYFLLVLFNFSWIVVGSVVLFNDFECKEDSYNIYAIMLAILVISYICIGIFFLTCCAAVIFGVGFLSKLRNKGQKH